MANILVLDDISDAGMLVKRILERKGHEVWNFTEEEDALKHAAGTRIDLAILDIKLKKMTGVEALEELKKVNPDMKAIMLDRLSNPGNRPRVPQARGPGVLRQAHQQGGAGGQGGRSPRRRRIDGPEARVP